MRNILRSFYVVLLVGLLAACGGEDEPLGIFEPGPLGAVEVGEDGGVQIRSVLAHTNVSSVAATMRYGVELAIQDFGNIHGHEIELGEPIDAMCLPEGGRTSAQQVIADPQILGVIGTLCSASAVTASPLLSEAGLVMVSPANTSPALTSDLAGNAGPDYHPGFFRTISNDLYQARAVAEPDGIFFPLFDAEGLPFAEQVREFDDLAGVSLITGEALLLPEFLGTPQSEGIYLAGPEAAHGSGANVATGKDAAAVLAAYQATYGESPSVPHWRHAYDAATLLLSAIESVAVMEGGKLYVDRAALRQEIGATDGFQGLLGVLSCDDFGDCGTGHVTIYHHTDSTVTDPAQLPVIYHFP